MCNALKTSLAAIGDPVDHPLRGIEQTKWASAWTQEFQRLAATLKSSTVELVRAADAFAAIIGFPPGFYDRADIPRLARFGEFLTRPEAADGVLLLGPGNSERGRTLRARAALARRIAEKSAELGAQYDLKAVLRLDLPALHREWKDAAASNFMLRSGRQKKVRSALQPSCSASIPRDVGRDLFQSPVGF